MLTDRQIKFAYGPAWGRACAANDWRMQRGRLVCMDRAEDGRGNGRGLAQNSDLHTQVWRWAETLAERAHRAVTVEDLRRACVVVVSGKVQSTKDLSNPQFTKLLTLFALLADPDDLNARLAWDHPEIQERKRLAAGIRRKAPFAYIDTVAKSRFGSQYHSPRIEDLPLPCLRQLAITIENRRRAKEKEVDTDNCPF